MNDPYNILAKAQYQKKHLVMHVYHNSTMNSLYTPILSWATPIKDTCLKDQLGKLMMVAAWEIFLQADQSLNKIRM